MEEKNIVLEWTVIESGALTAPASNMFTDRKGGE